TLPSSFMQSVYRTAAITWPVPRSARTAAVGVEFTVGDLRQELLAKFALEHLAVAALGKLVDVQVTLGPLEAGDALEQMCVEFRLGGRPHDEGDDDLAPVLVRRTHHAGLGDTRMLEQHLLHLARVDVAAAADDDVLGA